MKHVPPNAWGDRNEIHPDRRTPRKYPLLFSFIHKSLLGLPCERIEEVNIKHFNNNSEY